jgi:hypothetical protein
MIFSPLGNINFLHVYYSINVAISDTGHFEDTKTTSHGYSSGNRRIARGECAEIGQTAVDTSVIGTRVVVLDALTNHIAKVQ